MITANDLRIGNWLEYTDNKAKKYIQVQLSDFSDICEEEEDSNNYYKPIPLTEKILLDCGFFKTNGYPYKFLNGYLKVRNGIYFYKYYNQEINLQYLHELQNLFYSLTKTELTINL